MLMLFRSIVFAVSALVGWLVAGLAYAQLAHAQPVADEPVPACASLEGPGLCLSRELARDALVAYETMPNLKYQLALMNDINATQAQRIDALETALGESTNAEMDTRDSLRECQVSNQHLDAVVSRRRKKFLTGLAIGLSAGFGLGVGGTVLVGIYI